MKESWLTRIKDFWLNIIEFIKNIWLFRKQLWQYRWYHYTYVLRIFSRGLADMSKNFELYGHEVDASRFNKIEKINRAVYLLNVIINDSYIEEAETQSGKQFNPKYKFVPSEHGPDLYSLEYTNTEEEKANNNIVLKLSHEIERQYWNELWDIIKGNDVECENGTDMRRWWD